MQSGRPLTLILSPLRAGRGELERTRLDHCSVPPNVSLSLSKRVSVYRGWCGRPARPSRRPAGRRVREAWTREYSIVPLDATLRAVGRVARRNRRVACATHGKHIPERERGTFGGTVSGSPNRDPRKMRSCSPLPARSGERIKVRGNFDCMPTAKRNHAVGKGERDRPGRSVRSRRYVFSVGSTGDSPVPSGDPPDDTKGGIERNNGVFSRPGFTNTPPGGSPGGAGGTPAGRPHHPR